MGNRRKSRWERTKGKLGFRSKQAEDVFLNHEPMLVKEEAVKRINVPKQDKVVMKTVPAKADGEVIGEAVIYTDGTFDIIVFEGISDEARAKLYSFQEEMLTVEASEATEEA